MRNASKQWPRAAVKAAWRTGYAVAMKVVTTRQECERTTLPIGFVRLLPRFVHQVQRLAREMEAFLYRINLCLGEAHNAKHLAKYMGKTGQSMSGIDNKTFC